MRKRRTLSAVFAALLSVPLAAIGVCGAVAPFAVAPSVCAAPVQGAGDCCSRSSSPAPRTPAPDRCAACGVAACALGEAWEAARPARDASASKVDNRPGVPHDALRTAAARALTVLAESPPRHLLLVTFRN